MARGTNIHIEFSFESNEGEEIVVDASAHMTKYVPARIHPVDKSHDAEGGDIEDICLMRNGDELDVDDAIAMGMKLETLEQAFVDAAMDEDEGPDCDDFDDRDNDY